MKDFIYKHIAFILIITITLTSCERDDLCPQDTPITPQLFIEFFDNDNPTELLAPRNLVIIEEGTVLEEGGTNFIAGISTSVLLPLRTDTDQTRYEFILNAVDATNENPENTDTFVIDYERTEEFLSKACGFRVIFNGVDAQDFEGDDGAWIQNIELINTSITDETEAHISIFH